jgi:glycosyltransferase involved in cell wall biosynthesis
LIKLVDLTYYAHLHYNHSHQVTENHAPALAFAPYLKNKLDLYFVKHAAFEEHNVIDGIPYHFFKGRNRFWSVTLKTHLYIRKLKPDIVLVQGLVFPLQVLFLRLFCGKGFKIVIQHHGELPFSGIKGWLQKLFCRLVDAYIFTAAGNALIWKKRNIIKPDASIFELLEASTEFKKQDKLESKQRTGIAGTTNFLWVGRLNANKDPLTVLTGFEQYLSINTGAKLYMIYQTDDLLNEVINKFASNQLLADAVTLVGKIPNHELPYWYSAADFYISGSHKEGSGYALLEAMACGCIPVVTNIPSYQKITRNGKVGFLYPSGNSAALTTLLSTINNLNREELSAATLNHFNQNLTFKNIADDLFDICSYLMRE